MLRLMFFVFVLGAGVVPAIGAQRVAPTAPAITASELRRRLFLIADDSMRGRDTGSREDSIAADYVAAEFRRVGLRPAGEEGGWFQSVPFSIPAQPAAALEIQSAGTLVPNVDFMAVGRPNMSPMLDHVRAVYGGTAGDSTTWISAAEASGKVVVLDLRAPAAGGRPTLASQAVFGNRRFAAARAIAVVALGVVDPALEFTLTHPRPTTNPATSAGPFQLLVTPNGAAQLLGGVPTSLQPGTVGHQVTGSPARQFVPVAHAARNVIGILPGSDPGLRGEYVSMTAHNDHVGICSAPIDHDSIRAFNRVYRPMGADTRTFVASPASDARVRAILDSLRRIRPARADSICNGADDDGSGTAAILELAEYFAGLPPAQRPKRSLLFVSHVGEEVGLSGSAWYTDHSTVPMDSIVAEIDEDMVGRGAVGDLPAGGPTYLEVIGAKRLSVEYGELLEAVNASQPVPFVFNYQFDQPGDPLNYYCRADHYNYARYGVPSVALSRGEHLDYHQVTDEAQYIDYDDMARVVNFVRDAALRVANLDHRPRLDKPKGDPHARCSQ